MIHLLRAAALLGIAALIAKLFATGQMALYMSPTLDPLTSITGVVSACLGVWELRAGMRGDDPYAGLSADHVLTVGLVLLPVALGLIITPRALNSSALQGEDLNRLVLAYSREPGNTVTRAATASDQAPELFAFLRQSGAQGLGQRVHGTGMVARAARTSDNEFVLLRYSIVHCVADARPLGVLVVGDALTWQPDEWVEVVGELDALEQGGEYLVAVRASTISPTSEPPNPYLPPM